MGAHLAVLLVFSLSCCESSPKGSGGGSGDKGAGIEEAGGRPAAMAEALARGKKENKVVVVEYFDTECNYAQEMQGSLLQKVVLEELKNMVHVKVHQDAAGMGFAVEPTASPVAEMTPNTSEGEAPARRPVRREQPKVGRNAPCPCGSGKKYKKCCGRA